MSKKIKLRKGRYAIVDDEDYFYLSRFNWSLSISGGVEYVVVIFADKGKSIHIPLHKFILGTTVRNAKKLLHHRNGNRLDFRKSNLVFWTKSETVHNGVVPRRMKSSRYKGIGKLSNHVDRTRKKRYFACITKNLKRYYARFYSEKEAVDWYNKKAKELYKNRANQHIYKYE